MNIRIIAATDIGSFIAADSDGSYYVLTLDDTRDIKLGDVLCGTFDGHGSELMTVRNVSRSEDVRICLDFFEEPLANAIRALLSLVRNKTQPSKIHTISKDFLSDTDDIDGDLLRELVRS